MTLVHLTLPTKRAYRLTGEPFLKQMDCSLKTATSPVPGQLNSPNSAPKCHT